MKASVERSRRFERETPPPCGQKVEVHIKLLHLHCMNRSAGPPTRAHPPSAAVTASTLLGRVSVIIWSLLEFLHVLPEEHM